MPKKKKEKFDARGSLISLFHSLLAYLIKTLQGNTETKVNASFLDTCIAFLRLNNVNVDTLDRFGLTSEEVIQEQLKNLEINLPELPEDLELQYR